MYRLAPRKQLAEDTDPGTGGRHKNDRVWTGAFAVVGNDRATLPGDPANDPGKPVAGVERVGVSQPSLSQQIVGLDYALGVTLVERGQRGAVLTPQGRMILN